ncbi:mitochondrial uncoupling protein 4-like [Neltuma alba]|uniref:mitochondrial uncoupling protein 4-like n=1 Tax=Neltuma alba TaxID=207710 RepID=UPI0010A58EE4|nr:mitochondrial uncoupling protein 4-like [Prosopis alba]
MGVKSFVEGGITSIVAGCSTHPLDLIKVGCSFRAISSSGCFFLTWHCSSWFQSRTHIGWCADSSLRGVSALFSGVSATMLCQTLYSTTRVGLYMCSSKRDRPR